MKKVYIIKFDNGEEYDLNVVSDWTFTETEDEAVKLVDKLNTQLEIDENRYSYLLDHSDSLVFDERGNFNGSDTADEFERLGCKYPAYSMSCYKESKGYFYYTELEKQEES